MNIDFLRPNLIPDEVREKIMLPEVFDQDLCSGKIDHGVVLACTTMTMPRLLKDVNREGIAGKEQWIAVFRRKSEKVVIGKWPFKREKRVEYEDGETKVGQIQENRKYWGWQMGLRDALGSLYPRAGEKIFSDRYADILYTNRTYDEGNPVNDFTGLSELIQRTHTYPNHRISPEKADEAATLFINALAGSYDSLNEVLTEARRRRGVQVVYGHGSFDHTPHRETGDLMSSKRIPGRISPEHITAILPIGRHEQEFLLGR